MSAVVAMPPVQPGDQSTPSASPAAPNAVEFRYTQTDRFVELLHRLGASLLVSTYQANKLVAVRAGGGGLSTLVRTFDRPMGLAASGGRLALGTRQEVWVFRNAPDLAPRVAPAGRHDACFVPRSAHVTGHAAPGAAADPAHSARIDATNFALANDDGSGARDYRSADLILIGVSRTSKTPTSLYLALQYGVFTANYPLTDEDLETGKLPKVLQPFVSKLFGLTIDAERLQLIRQERRPGSRYASPQQVRYEVRTALSLFERQSIPHLDVSECNVEEIASRILSRMNLERRVRG